MRVLHITTHLGGGLGSVVMDWVKNAGEGHVIAALDYVSGFAANFCKQHSIHLVQRCSPREVLFLIGKAEIVMVHWYDHLDLFHLFAAPLPACRLIFWCHKNYQISRAEKGYPDRFYGTSPVQGLPGWIWSTRDMEPFLKVERKHHDRFTVGYVGTIDYKKIHPSFVGVWCSGVQAVIPDARFLMVGSPNISLNDALQFDCTGHVDDVKPYLAEMDVLGYPLRYDHYGTCEQVLGEAMSAGVIPVVLDNPTEKYILDSQGICTYVASTPREYVSLIKHIRGLPGKVRGLISSYYRQRAKVLYNQKKMISQWEEIFEDIMCQPKRQHMGLLV